MAEAPLGITPTEIINHEIAISDQHVEVAAQLGRVVSTSNKAMQERAVEAAAELLDPENLQTVEDGEVTNNFQILDILPDLHKIDPEVTEEIIVELAVAEPLIDNQAFIRDLGEELAALRSDEPLIELPKIQRELARADALVEIHSQRDTHYPAE